MSNTPKTTTYRGFTVEILPRKGFAGRIWYFYRIGGNGLKAPIATDMGLETESLAEGEAKEFISEDAAWAHLQDTPAQEGSE